MPWARASGLTTLTLSAGQQGQPQGSLVLTGAAGRFWR